MSVIVKEQKRMTSLATLKNWNKSPTTGCPDWCGCYDLCGFVTSMIVVTIVWVVTDADGRDRCGDVNGAGVVTGVVDVIGVVMWPVRGS